MSRFQIPDSWCAQAYKFCLDSGERMDPVEASHLGAKRFAKKWALRLVEDQLRRRNTYRVLALRQRASTKDADNPRATDPKTRTFRAPCRLAAVRITSRCARTASSVGVRFI